MPSLAASVWSTSMSLRLNISTHLPRPGHGFPVSLDVRGGLLPSGCQFESEVMISETQLGSVSGERSDGFLRRCSPKNQNDVRRLELRRHTCLTCS